MQIDLIFQKSLNFDKISSAEALFLYKNAPLTTLMFYANQLRKKIHNNNYVSYIIDRNINYSNICSSKCMFCNFCRNSNEEDAYTLSINDFIPKIDELYKKGGNQILLQGGMNPNIGTDYYTNLFKSLKKKYSGLKLHALSPPEIVYLAKKENLPFEQIIIKLQNAGLDSIPGGGAEILSDRVRKIISPAKCTTDEWLKVMHAAHKLNITTSATMMFGHIETPEERMEHLCLLRDTQNRKPKTAKGFISFTLWPLAGNNTKLLKKFSDIKPIYADEYIKMLAISRLVLNNIPNIQVSWLTMGKEVAGVCLFAGANDLSSIMIEENVLLSAGKNYKMNQTDIEKMIKSLRLKPMKRNQEYEKL